MKQVVTFKEKSIYGRILIYPNCEKSNIFSHLIGSQIFTTTHLSLIESLGYTVHLVKLP